MKLKEAGEQIHTSPQFTSTTTGFRHPGGGGDLKIGTFTTWTNKGYQRDTDPKANKKGDPYGPESKVDPHIEQQLIDRAIDILFNEHPNLIQDKTIRRHHINMLIGKVTSGEVNDLITIKQFIKSLKKRKIKVEQKMKIKKSEIKDVVREILSELEVGEEATNLDYYINKNYEPDDLKYGDAKGGAQAGRAIIKKIEMAMKKFSDIEKKAGNLKGPGVQRLFWFELGRVLKKYMSNTGAGYLKSTL